MRARRTLAASMMMLLPVLAWAQSQPSFPGLSASSVEGSLQGFACHSWVLKGGDTDYDCVWNSNGESYTVDLTGADDDHIVDVTAAVMPNGSEPFSAQARQFLVYMASLPYDGADPSAAQQWAKSSLGSTVSSVIANAKFSLYWSESVASLEITPLRG